MCNSSKSEYYVSVELVDKMVTSLKDGKAAGIDNVTSEHIKHSHPIIITLLTKLYDLMIKYHYVPDAFGIGLTVPVPKSANGNCYHTDDYRGITISSVLSEIFEHCILVQYSLFFTSSESNLGLKRKVALVMQFIQCVKPLIISLKGIQH